jgi:CheY-like chemotaxis protein
LESTGFRLRALLDDLAWSLSAMARRAGLGFDVSVDPDVPDALGGDPARLRQVLRNLLSNALKFTERGEVSLRAELVAEGPDGSRIRFTVRDTGVGIAKDKQAAIFEAFVQADSSTTRRFGGTGLGLAIVSHLVDLMHGSLGLESAPGEGSTFTVELPFAPGEDAPVSEAAGLAGLDVLVAEPHELTTQVIGRMITDWGLRPTFASTGPAAVEAIRSAAAAGTPFRLAIISSELPDLDGFTVIERVRSGASPSQLPIIMLAAEGRRGDGARCASLGVAAYLPKPARPSDLLQAIQAACGQAAAKVGDPLVTAHSLRATDLPRNILVAEDNDFNAMVSLGMLERAGHRVTRVRTGREALDAVSAHRFDIVLMDVEMPVMDGFAATAAIRDLERASGTHVPIVAMTAHVLAGDREACLGVGMDAYLSKPIRRDELLAAVKHLTSEASGTTVRLPDLKLDRDALLAEAGGDPELLGRVADQFRIQLADLVAKLREGVRLRSASEIEFAAHSLKGSIAFWDRGRAYAAARDLERCASEHRLEDAPGLLVILDQAIPALQREIELLRGIGGPS